GYACRRRRAAHPRWLWSGNGIAADAGRTAALKLQPDQWNQDDERFRGFPCGQHDRLAEHFARSKITVAGSQRADVASPDLLVVAPVDSRSEPRRDGPMHERLRAVCEERQPLLKRCSPAEVTNFGKSGMVLCCTSQIIGAAIFYRFGQPMRHREEHRHLAALPAKIGRSGREKGFEQGVDVAG